MDPPRAGSTQAFIESIKVLQPRQVIYVSCDPQTLVRDFTLLSSIYEIKKSYILDMFSYTYHVECVSVLSRKAQ